MEKLGLQSLSIFLVQGIEWGWGHLFFLFFLWGVFLVSLCILNAEHSVVFTPQYFIPENLGFINRVDFQRKNSSL